MALNRKQVKDKIGDVKRLLKAIESGLNFIVIEASATFAQSKKKSISQPKREFAIEVFKKALTVDLWSDVYITNQCAGIDYSLTANKRIAQIVFTENYDEFLIRNNIT